MHHTSMENMRKCLDRFVEPTFFTDKRRRVVDIGAQDVNGSYRSLFEVGLVDYIGVDMAPGKGVDIVLDDPYCLPFEAGSVDLVLCGQMLEHSEYFWLAFAEMVRILAPDGYLLLIAPSSGHIHRYPVDCYRFYPDSYHALAKANACHVVSVWCDERGEWRDLVGVFSKDPTSAGRAPYPTPKRAQNAEPPDGGPDLEKMTGCQWYLDTLTRVHAALQPSRYLEIGVWRGHSMALAQCPSIGVEPDPVPELIVSSTCRMVHQSSDDFFDDNADRLLADRPDLAFIDGLHQFEYVLRDFINTERHSHVGSCIVIDDIFPNCAEQASRVRITRAWTGDVWKLAVCLRLYRPDLHLIQLDTYPTGLLIVLGLDPQNQVLLKYYDDILDRYNGDPALSRPPAAVVDREGAIDPTSLALDALFAQVYSARAQSSPRPIIDAAVADFYAAVLTER